MSGIYAIFSFLSIVMLCCIWQFGIKGSILENFRNDLFEIRHKLLLYGYDNKNLSYEDKEYIEIEANINSVIRYAHKITAFNVVLMLVFFKNKKTNLKINKEKTNLKKEVKIKLDGFRKELNEKLFFYILRTSLTASIVVVFYGIHLLIKKGFNKSMAKKAEKEKIVKEMKKFGIETLIMEQAEKDSYCFS